MVNALNYSLPVMLSEVEARESWGGYFKKLIILL
jgi:hypothetical protein